MNSLEDVSLRLMRPAKDLADWNFPLSQILEEYYVLLEAPECINFGEAALVLQNSASAYAHRIDRLFNETEGFVKQMLTSFHTNEAVPKKNTGHGNKRDKSLPHLDNFSLISLENELGRNINLKSKNERVKLISRRFTQLEITGTQIKIPIFDVYGEIIGKKYDFRCNQPVKINGELVDELTPDDFQQADAAVATGKKQDRTFSTDSSVCSGNAHETETSGYASNQSRLNSTSSNELVPESPCGSPTGHFSPIPEDVDLSNEKKQCNAPLNVSTNGEDSAETVAPRRSCRLKRKTEAIEESNLKEPCPPQQDSQAKKNAVKSPGAKSPIKIPGGLGGDGKTSYGKRRNATTSTRTKKRDEVLKETGSAEKRRNGTARSSFFKPLTKYELENFERSIHACFEEAYRKLRITRYEPVIHGPTMDLVGFRPCPANGSSSSIFSGENVPRSPSPDTQDDSGVNSMFDESMDDLQPDFYLPDYRTLVEDRMKQIFKESEVTTELQEAVSQWHEWIKPKLSAAEERPVFRIHEYASQIIDTLRNVGKRRCTLEDVIAGKPTCEVARYFLASLQLANMCNVEINPTGGNQRSIEIVLLDEESVTDV